MKKAMVAAIVALMVVGSGAVYAQHRHYERHHPRFTVQDRLAFVDARIAAVKAGLQLTPEQEKNWPAVESAVRDFAKQRIDTAEARRKEREVRLEDKDQKDGSSTGTDDKEFDPVARLEKRADDLAATAAGLKKIADAADPLYKSLDDAQKRRLAVLTHFKGHHGWGHSFGFGWGGPHGHPNDQDGPDHGPKRL